MVGTAVSGFNGDGACSTAEIDSPQGVCLDTIYNCYIADRNNNRIRYVNYKLGVVETAPAQVELDVYPNPNSGQLQLMIKNAYSVYSVVITDLTGRVRYKDQIEGNIIHLLSLPFSSGIYCLHLTGDGLDTYRKILINR